MIVQRLNETYDALLCGWERPSSRATARQRPRDARPPHLSSRFPTAAAVGPRDDFQQVAARVLEIDAPPAVVTVDLPCLGPRRIGPMGEAPFLHAAEDLVELRFAHEESVVLRPDLPLLVHEIDVDAVCRGDDLEGSPFLRGLGGPACWQGTLPRPCCRWTRRWCG